MKPILKVESGIRFPAVTDFRRQARAKLPPQGRIVCLYRLETGAYSVRTVTAPGLSRVKPFA